MLRNNEKETNPLLFREQMSALMDDELPPDQKERVLDQLKKNPCLQKEWRNFHFIKFALESKMKK